MSATISVPACIVRLDNFLFTGEQTHEFAAKRWTCATMVILVFAVISVSISNDLSDLIDAGNGRRSSLTQQRLQGVTFPWPMHWEGQDCFKPLWNILLLRTQTKKSPPGCLEIPYDFIELIRTTTISLICNTRSTLFQTYSLPSYMFKFERYDRLFIPIVLECQLASSIIIPLSLAVNLGNVIMGAWFLKISVNAQKMLIFSWDFDSLWSHKWEGGNLKHGAATLAAEEPLVVQFLLRCLTTVALRNRDRQTLHRSPFCRSVSVPVLLLEIASALQPCKLASVKMGRLQWALSQKGL